MHDAGRPLDAPPAFSQLTEADTPQTGLLDVGMATRNFRRQHEELQRLARELSQYLVPARLSQHATLVRRLLARFLGLLEIHARMEGEALYPRLLRSPADDVREAADALHRQVGKLYADVAVFGRTWLASGAIEADPNGFMRAASESLRALGRRMAREEAELYPMAERAALRSSW